jgi:DNA-binding FadR family transcriptional regulator
MTFHPASRFGDLPYSPNMHDDIFHLRRWLREVFAYILIGRHDPGQQAAMREYVERQSPRSGV